MLLPYTHLPVCTLFVDVLNSTPSADCHFFCLFLPALITKYLQSGLKAQPTLCLEVKCLVTFVALA